MGYILPRRPPVPNGITVQNTSSSSFQLYAAICSATCGAYSAYRGSVSHLRTFLTADADSMLLAAADSSSATARVRSKACVMQVISRKAADAQRVEGHLAHCCLQLRTQPATTTCGGSPTVRIYPSQARQKLPKFSLRRHFYRRFSPRFAIGIWGRR